jgi:hypothetical protein
MTPETLSGRLSPSARRIAFWHSPGPGARAVKRALINTDSAAARQARLDSALREP